MIKLFVTTFLFVISSQVFAQQPEVFITEVFPNFNDETFEILGGNFALGPNALQVTLGNYGNLVIIFDDANMIVAAFPVDLVNGDFLLTVFSGPGPRKNANHIVTVGAIGPEGPEGAEGPMGATGADGPMGTTGATGGIGPAGPMGATGAAGPMGSAGATGPEGPEGVEGPEGPEVTVTSSGGRNFGSRKE